MDWKLLRVIWKDDYSRRDQSLCAYSLNLHPYIERFKGIFHTEMEIYSSFIHLQTNWDVGEWGCLWFHKMQVNSLMTLGVKKKTIYIHIYRQNKMTTDDTFINLHHFMNHRGPLFLVKIFNVLLKTNGTYMLDGLRESKQTANFHIFLTELLHFFQKRRHPTGRLWRMVERIHDVDWKVHIFIFRGTNLVFFFLCL